MTKKVGLVLSGGGGKGAYEVGVWKALEEFGITENISVISGTSVGALNAVLLAQHGSDVAAQVWERIGPDDILYFDFRKILPTLLMLGLGPKSRLFAFSKMFRGGIFSRKGLRRILDEYLDMTMLAESRTKIYAACTRIMPPRAEYFGINGLSEDEAVNVLLASSAIPGVFGKVDVNGASYYDGGILDNTPVRPVYEERCDTIITVLLNQTDYISFQDYPDSTFLPIYPQDDLGGFFTGVLRFDNSEEAMRRGYEDTQKVIGPAYDLAKSQFAVSRCLHQIRLYNAYFQRYAEGKENLFGEVTTAVQSLQKDLDDI